MSMTATARTPGGVPAAPHDRAAQSPAGPGFHALDRKQLIGTIVALLLTLLLAALDQTIVGTAMPRIIAELNGFDRYAWVTTAYLLTSTIAVPIFGKLSDIYGRKWFFLSGATLFVLASALCGAAGNVPLVPGDGMTQLIIFRGLQGLAGGIITGLTFTVIADIFPPAERGKFQGLFGAVWGLSSVLGPTLGGWITDNFSWRWVFYVNLPVGLIAIAVLFFAFPYFRPEGVTRAIDYFGVATLTAGLVPLLLGLTWVTDYGWTAPRVLILFAVAVVMLAAFIFAETRAPEPIIPLTLFRNSIVSVSSIAVFFTGVGMFGAILFIPLFMQSVVGVSATRSGTTLTPMMLTLVVGSIASGQLVARLGRYKIISSAGLAIMAGGMFLLAGMGSDTTEWIAIRNMIVVGVGLGVTMPIYTLIVQNAVPVRQLGTATAATQFFRSIGGTIGAAVFGSIMLSRYQGNFNANIPAGAPPPLIAAFKNPLQLAQILPRLQAQFGQAPDGARALAALLGNVREALVFALRGTFLLGAALIVVAFLVNFFLKEIPLRKRMAPAAAMAEGGAPEPAEAFEATLAPAAATADGQAGGDAASGHSNRYAPAGESVPLDAPGGAWREDNAMHEYRDDARLSGADGGADFAAQPGAPGAPSVVAAAAPAYPPGVSVASQPATEPATDTAAGDAFLRELGALIRREVQASQRALADRLAALEVAVASLQTPGQAAPAPVRDEERLAALEQRLTHLDWRVQEQSGSDLTVEMEARLDKIERTVERLDAFARTLPPARWHHAHDARSAETQRRLATLEHEWQQSAWSHAPAGYGSADAPDGNGSGTNVPMPAPPHPARR